MLRLRLATLALASGLLFTLSGCTSFSEDGRMFPRLFHSNSTPIDGMPGECGCQQSFQGGPPLPPIMDSASMSGPAWSQTGPQVMPIPITNVPSNQPPPFPKVLQAQPGPYHPAN